MQHSNIYPMPRGCLSKWCMRPAFHTTFIKVEYASLMHFSSKLLRIIYVRRKLENRKHILENHIQFLLEKMMSYNSGSIYLNLFWTCNRNCTSWSIKIDLYLSLYLDIACWCCEIKTKKKDTYQSQQTVYFGSSDF